MRLTRATFGIGWPTDFATGVVQETFVLACASGWYGEVGNQHVAQARAGEFPSGGRWVAGSERLHFAKHSQPKKLDTIVCLLGAIRPVMAPVDAVSKDRAPSQASGAIAGGECHSSAKDTWCLHVSAAPSLERRSDPATLMRVAAR